jgi:hypothetical protein
MEDATFVEQRRILRSRPKHRFLEREAYCELLISPRRRLERSDDERANVRGLVDHDTGMRYLIEEERLMPDR